MSRVDVAWAAARRRLVVDANDERVFVCIVLRALQRAVDADELVAIPNDDGTTSYCTSGRTAGIDAMARLERPSWAIADASRQPPTVPAFIGVDGQRGSVDVRYFENVEAAALVYMRALDACHRLRATAVPYSIYRTVVAVMREPEQHQELLRAGVYAHEADMWVAATINAAAFDQATELLDGSSAADTDDDDTAMSAASSLDTPPQDSTESMDDDDDDDDDDDTSSELSLSLEYAAPNATPETSKPVHVRRVARIVNVDHVLTDRVRDGEGCMAFVAVFRRAYAARLCSIMHQRRFDVNDDRTATPTTNSVDAAAIDRALAEATLNTSADVREPYIPPAAVDAQDVHLLDELARCCAASSSLEAGRARVRGIVDVLMDRGDADMSGGSSSSNNRQKARRTVQRRAFAHIRPVAVVDAAVQLARIVEAVRCAYVTSAHDADIVDRAMRVYQAAARASVGVPVRSHRRDGGDEVAAALAHRLTDVPRLTDAFHVVIDANARQRGRLVPCVVLAAVTGVQLASRIGSPHQRAQCVDLIERRQGDAAVVAVHFEASMAPVPTPLELVSTVRALFPEARDGNDFVVVWSADALRDRACLLVDKQRWNVIERGEVLRTIAAAQRAHVGYFGANDRHQIDRWAPSVAAAILCDGDRPAIVGRALAAVATFLNVRRYERNRVTAAIAESAALVRRLDSVVRVAARPFMHVVGNDRVAAVTLAAARALRDGDRSPLWTVFETVFCLEPPSSLVTTVPRDLAERLDAEYHAHVGTTHMNGRKRANADSHSARNLIQPRVAAGYLACQSLSDADRSHDPTASSSSPAVRRSTDRIRLLADVGWRAHTRLLDVVLNDGENATIERAASVRVNERAPKMPFSAGNQPQRTLDEWVTTVREAAGERRSVTSKHGRVFSEFIVALEALGRMRAELRIDDGVLEHVCTLVRAHVADDNAARTTATLTVTPLLRRIHGGTTMDVFPLAPSALTTSIDSTMRSLDATSLLCDRTAAAPNGAPSVSAHMGVRPLCDAQPLLLESMANVW